MTNNFSIVYIVSGIGVDDLFVIVQSWENIGGPTPDDRSIPQKISLTIRHAGVSVLVTSVTDICAFAIGSATVRILTCANLCLSPVLISGALISM